ncbi:hypothetical protein BGX27_010090 [Mortierella sp. AM989]|nr:hypothetical protein BGX27_010090 [Mortierella sp. AM989]
MHQDHNIPWQTLAKNFAVRSNNDLQNLYPLDKPNQGKEFEYFSKTLIRTIREFATTERQKYPDTIQMQDTGKIFSDELLDSISIEHQKPDFYCEDYLTKENQDIEYWIRSARVHHENNPDYHYSELTYTTNDMDLASAVKYLIIKNEMSSLLMMARHPSIPLDCLFILSWGHSFGWDRLIGSALDAYVYINVLGEFPKLCQDVKYNDLECHKRLMRALTSTCDGDAQIALHRPFFLRPQEELEEPRRGIWPNPEIFRDIFEDMGRLKVYLKSCFEALYRCEMLAKECGISIEWEEEISASLRYLNVDSWHRLVPDGEGGSTARLTYGKRTKGME